MILSEREKQIVDEAEMKLSAMRNRRVFLFASDTRTHENPVLDELIIKTCAFFGINLEDFKSTCRKTDNVFARKFFSKYAKDTYGDGLSLAKIAQCYGKKHDAAIHHRNHLNDLLLTNKQIRERYTNYIIFLK